MARPQPAHTPRYPVYLSPDGVTEQVAATPAREVQLKYMGWTQISAPRRRPANAEKPNPADNET